MRIVFTDQFSDPGGAQQCLMDLLPAVLARGWKPVVMAPGNGRLIQWCAENRIAVRPLPLSNYSSGQKSATDALRFAFDWPGARTAIRDAVSDHGCDLLYINGPRILPAVTGLGLPCIFHAHNRIGGAAVRSFARTLLKRARMPVIAVSRFVAEQFPSQPGEVVYNGVKDCARDKLDSAGGLRIGILGRIAPEKGHLDFVRAARMLRQQLSGIRFEIFGTSLFSDGDYERVVRAECADLPVTFHGWREPAEALAAMDILAVPSGPNEAAGRVIPEALSARVPVVACAAGGIPELLEHRKTGLLTEMGSPEHLAKSILELESQPELCRLLSDAGRVEWENRFSLEKYQQRICDRIQAEAIR